MPTLLDSPRRVSVLVPVPLDGVFDYTVPEGLHLSPGDLVRVPFGKQVHAGVVWHGDGNGDSGDSGKRGAGARDDARRLKAVIDRFDAPPMVEAMRRFVDWVAAYTMSPRGAVLRMALSVPAALEQPRPTTAFAPARPLPEGLKMTAARTRVIEVAAAGPPRSATELAREAAVSPGVVRGLADAGALHGVSIRHEPHLALPDPDRPGPVLSAEQARAAADLRLKVAAGAFETVLLDGVPGSGKTEVYFEAVIEALSRQRQCLVLLPEIALSAQWLARFAERFGAEPALWHSELTPAQRRHTWRAVAEGRAPVVVGARSALFLPFPDLGLIVVDEEHEAAFKQEDGVIYNARDMAVVRARFAGVPVVLASATPSLESVVNADQGRYARLHLPERHAGAAMPSVAPVDMRRHPAPAGSWLSPTLRDALAACLAAGEQAVLFLNRRGYAPLTLCRACGYRLQCPHCTAWLVEHRAFGRLQCHHCGHVAAIPDTCPACEAEGRFVPCGPGVERLAEEVAELFPDARTALAASDTLSGPRAAAELVRQVEEHEVDLVVGTQIVAKGYHFPLLTLVGVVDADLGLSGGDLRAAERTFQLLTQVAGRAGRAERPGRVLVQTYMPEHPVIQALVVGDRDGFLKAEADARRQAGMPPFGRLVALVVSGTDGAAVDDAAAALGRSAPHGGGVTVLGPAPAPLALLRGRHRRRLLLMARRDIAVQPVVRDWLSRANVHRSIKVQVDIDPYTFL